MVKRWIEFSNAALVPEIITPTRCADRVRQLSRQRLGNCQALWRSKIDTENANIHAREYPLYLPSKKKSCSKSCRNGPGDDGATK